MRTYAHDRLVFDVKDEGPEGGTPVVLLHGFPQDSTAWDAVVGPLHEQGYRTLAPNQRGYSPGARPSGAKHYVWSKLVGDVTALLDAAELERAHIVGHDWGGFVTWAVAAAAPERVLTATSLSVPHPGAFRKAALRPGQALRSTYMGLMQIPWLSEQILRPGGPGWSALVKGLPPHQAAHYAERMSTPGALTAALSWYRVLPRELLRPSVRLDRVTVPSALVWGERDPALGRAGAEVTADFVAADYQFTILKDVGHWIPERAPESVVAALTARWSELPVT